MSQLLSRLLLAVVVIFATPFVFIMAFMISDDVIMFSVDEALIAADLVSGIFLIPLWILVWRRQVVWTRRRTLLTAAASIASSGPAALFSVLFVMPYDDEIGIVLGGACWLLLWLAGTAILWRETDLERAQRLGEIADEAVACPDCGYNMTGLHHARCPECGTQYTLDELFARSRENAGDIDT